MRILLECGMDFRDNWLVHFRAAVDQEIKAAKGDVVAGRKAVAQKLEKGEQTIYQHYTQKSGKVYPTVEMMVLLEKKYGKGRPVGWASRPLDGSNPELPQVELRVGLLALDAAITRADPGVQPELAKLFDLYLSAPDRYAKLLEDIEDILLERVPQT